MKIYITIFRHARYGTSTVIFKRMLIMRDHIQIICKVTAVMRLGIPRQRTQNLHHPTRDPEGDPATLLLPSRFHLKLRRCYAAYAWYPLTPMIPAVLDVINSSIVIAWSTGFCNKWGLGNVLYVVMSQCSWRNRGCSHAQFLRSFLHV